MFLSICLLCAAAVAVPGENLLVNGRLEADQTDCPGFWNPPEHAKIGERVFFEQAGGPEGIPCARFVNDGEPFTECSFRQVGITLVPGARYRISGKVRTRDFKGRGCLYVINYGWINEAGIGGFPENSPWTPYERDIVAPPNSNAKNYMVVMGAVRFSGEISFADLSLRPLDDAAKKGSAPPNAAKSEKLPRFFPWSPYLSQVDPDTRRVVFRFAGMLPAGDAFADYAVTLKTKDGETSAALADGENAFAIPGSLPSGMLRYEVRKKGSDSPLLSGGFHFRTVAKAEIDTSNHRRLNNLVTEVLSAEVSSDGAAFSVSRDGWVWIRAGRQSSPGAAVLLDGETLFAAGTAQVEVFRKLRAGRHVVAMGRPQDGKKAVAQIVVRQIPEIFNYPACANSPVGTNPSYGWKFYSAHVLPNCTTHNGGRIPAEHWDEFKRRGGGYLDNFVSRGMNAETFASKVAAASSLSRGGCDGMTLDEHMFSDVALFGDFIGGMRRFTAQYSGDRSIYTWIVNKPMLAGMDREVFALAANAAPSGGRILSEIYFRSRSTEAEALRYIDDYLVDTGRRFRELRPGVPFYPDAMSRVGVILANFSQIPTLSCWHHPQMDFKYFLDMQFNALANNEVFYGLGSVGVWGSYYADEDIYRWTFMLARHYCIEGRRDMLSPRHGLKYIPGIVRNGDFEDGLDGWRAEGGVEVRRVRGLAENVERRWGGAGSGDAFAVLSKAQGVSARLEQTMKGFKPGCMYSFDVVCFDAKDVAAKRHRPARHPLTVTLGAGAERDESTSWVFVDRRPKEGVRGWGVRCNRHHVVFTARSEEISLSLDNAAASDGDEIGVNWIGARPYVPGARQ